MVSLRQEESLAKLASFMPVALQISQDLRLVPVPIGTDSVLMGPKKTINLGNDCLNFNFFFAVRYFTLLRARPKFIDFGNPFQLLSKHRPGRIYMERKHAKMKF